MSSFTQAVARIAQTQGNGQGVDMGLQEAIAYLTGMWASHGVGNAVTGAIAHAQPHEIAQLRAYEARNSGRVNEALRSLQPAAEAEAAPAPAPKRKGK